MRKFGLQFDTIEKNHYCFGGGFIGTKELIPDGQWDNFLPPEEIQNRNNLETQNCTAFGTENCVNILMRYNFREDVNYSERFIGIMAGTDPLSGNSPHKVGESIRRNGLIAEKELPFDESIQSVEEYYSPRPMKVKYLIDGQKWLRQYQFKHEWIFTGNIFVQEKKRLIQEALKRGPVGMSVYAWYNDGEGIFQKRGEDNHWVCCYGWNEHGWKIFDSYTNSYKIYSFDSDISMAKLYWVAKAPVVKDPWYLEVIKNMLEFIKDLIFRKYA